MPEAGLNRLYADRILELAADIPFASRLDRADASIKKRAPLCGSTVTVDVVVENGRIARFGQDVKACALGQAAASVVGRVALGRSLEEIEAGRDALAAMLRGDGALPTAPFEDFAALAPAREFQNRHASILLAIEATAEAMAKAAAEAA